MFRRCFKAILGEIVRLLLVQFALTHVPVRLPHKIPILLRAPRNLFRLFITGYSVTGNDGVLQGPESYCLSQGSQCFHRLVQGEELPRTFKRENQSSILPCGWEGRGV